MIQTMINLLDEIHSVANDKQNYQMSSISDDQRTEINKDVETERDFLTKVGVFGVSNVGGCYLSPLVEGY